MIAAVIEWCARIDLGKKLIAVCVMTGPDVIMESTGSYWKPVFNILEGHVKVALANPEDVNHRRDSAYGVRSPAASPPRGLAVAFFWRLVL